MRELVHPLRIVRQPEEAELTQLGVRGWPIWEKEISTFPWKYEQTEICYFLEGDVVVTPENGPPLKMGKGDLVTFPAGLACTWDVRQPVKKHYMLK
jgi:uncharacterized protein